MKDLGVIRLARRIDPGLLGPSDLIPKTHFTSKALWDLLEDMLSVTPLFGGLGPPPLLGSRGRGGENLPEKLLDGGQSVLDERELPIGIYYWLNYPVGQLDSLRCVTCYFIGKLVG